MTKTYFFSLLDAKGVTKDIKVHHPLTDSLLWSYTHGGECSSSHFSYFMPQGERWVSLIASQNMASKRNFPTYRNWIL